MNQCQYGTVVMECIEYLQQHWIEKVDRKGIVVYMSSRCSSSSGKCTAAAAAAAVQQAGRRAGSGR